MSQKLLLVLPILAYAQTQETDCETYDVAACAGDSNCGVEDASCEGDFETYLGCLAVDLQAEPPVMRDQAGCTGWHGDPAVTGLECYWYEAGVLDPVFGPDNEIVPFIANGACLGPPAILFGCGIGDTDESSCDASPGCKWNEAECTDADDVCDNNADEDSCIAVDGCYWSDAAGDFDVELKGNDGAVVTKTETIKGGCGPCETEKADGTKGNEYLWLKDLEKPARCTITGSRDGLVESVSGSSTVSYVNAGAGSCGSGTPTPPGGVFGMDIACTKDEDETSGVPAAVPALALLALPAFF